MKCLIDVGFPTSDMLVMCRISCVWTRKPKTSYYRAWRSKKMGTKVVMEGPLRPSTGRTRDASVALASH